VDEIPQSSQEPPARPVRIVIAEEQPIFRDGLRYLLHTRPSLRVVGETGDVASAAALVRSFAPDILLLGMGRPPKPFRLEPLERLTASGSSAHTILLAPLVDAPAVRKAFQIGARGVVPTDSAPDILFRSIDSVMAGRYWIGCDDVSSVMAGLRKFEASRREAKAFRLTPRELQIVRAVVDGHSNKHIAGLLGIGENTVKRHLTHIFNKLGASDRVELALFAMYHRLLDSV
jgi:two-component system, NarL family, nitrate/nitrite response regulator NarL